MLTVKDALLMPAFKNSKLVAGHSKIDKSISWINIIEILDDLEHLKEGELLITTAYGFQNHDSNFTEIIKKLTEKNLAAIAIQVGHYLTKIPPSIIDLCQKYDLPLIQLPPSASFSEITRALIPLLSYEEIDYDYTENLNTRLTEALLLNLGIKGLADVLYDITKHPIRICNSFYQVVAFSGIDNISEKELITEYNVMKEKGQFEIINSLTKPYKISNDYHKSIPSQIILPIKSKGNIHGYISALQDKKSFSQKDLIALNLAASICALDLLKEDNLLKTKATFNQELINELLSDNPPSKKKLKEWEDKLQLSLDDNYTVCLITFKSREEFTILPKNIIRLLEFIFSQKNISAIIAKYNNEVIICLPTNHFKNEKNISIFINDIKDDIKKHYDNTKVIFGIGSSCDEIIKIKRCYEEALSVIKFNKLNHRENQVTFYKELGISRILLEVENKDVLYSFYNDIVAPLENYDKNYKINLIDTLKVFLDNLNINKASRELFIHRHTLSYRLKKIKELTNLNPYNSDDLFLFKMGLFVRDYLNKQKNISP